VMGGYKEGPLGGADDHLHLGGEDLQRMAGRPAASMGGRGGRELLAGVTRRVDEGTLKTIDGLWGQNTSNENRSNNRWNSSPLLLCNR